LKLSRKLEQPSDDDWENNDIIMVASTPLRHHTLGYGSRSDLALSELQYCLLEAIGLYCYLITDNLQEDLAGMVHFSHNSLNSSL
jgi:hypothetical protein